MYDLAVDPHRPPLSESSELFSKPQLNLQPMDVFEGERFRLDCISFVYAAERVNASMLQYSIYKDNSRVTSSNSLVSTANPAQNGNYTCKVQVWTGSSGFVKESLTVVLKAKGQVQETLSHFYFRGPELSNKS